MRVRHIAFAFAAVVIAATACAPQPPPQPVFDPLLPGVAIDYRYELPRLSAGGDLVVFSSEDSTLAPGRGGNASTVFVLDLHTRAVQAHPLTPGCEDAGMASLSPNGRYVAYVCFADPVAGWAVSVWDRTDDSVTSTPTTIAGGKPFLAWATDVTDDARVLYHGTLPNDTYPTLSPVVWDSIANTYNGAPPDDVGQRVLNSLWGMAAPHLSTDGSSAWVDVGNHPVGGITGQSALWDLDSGTWIPLANPTAGLVESCCVAPSADHSQMATWVVDLDELHIHHVASGTTAIESTFPRGSSSTGVTAVSTDGASLWLDLYSNQPVTQPVSTKVLFNTHTGASKPITGAPPESFTVAVAADLSLGIALGPGNEMYALTPTP